MSVCEISTSQRMCVFLTANSSCSPIRMIFSERAPAAAARASTSSTPQSTAMVNFLVVILPSLF